MTVELIHGDAVEVMAGMPENSVDAVVTDPPYLLNFMGREWDGQGTHLNPKGMQVWHERWAREAFRVLKPGGHLLAFGGSRTSHRLACAIEDAGFEIRDSIVWMHAQGFPKSLDIGKAMDKANGNPASWLAFADAYAEAVERSPYAHADIDRHLGIKSSSCYWARRDHRGGMPPRHHWERVRNLLSLDASFAALYDEAEREVVGEWNMPGRGKRSEVQAYGLTNDRGTITSPATDLARQWDGWGTALKPAHEPVVCARKPLNLVPFGEIIASTTLAVEALLWSIAPAKLADRLSASSPHAPIEASGSARWLAVVWHMVPCDEASVQTDTFSSPAAASTFWSIVRSWSAILGALSSNPNTFTTETGTRLTTALTTLNSSILATIPESITQAATAHGGLWPNAETADASSSGGASSWSHIPTPSAHEHVSMRFIAHIAAELASIAAECSKHLLATDESSVQWSAPIDSTTPSDGKPRPAHEPIVVARKPLQGNVAQNVMRWGTGGLNIDGSRIGTAEKLRGSSVLNDIRGGQFGGGHRPNPGDIPAYEQHAVGRWPANVVLSHAPGCVPVGVRRVKVAYSQPNRGRLDGSLYEMGLEGDGRAVGYADPDGYETVEAWECERDPETGEYVCPVALLDEQAGERTSNGGKGPHVVQCHAGTGNLENWRTGKNERGTHVYGDTGGASRFFANFPPEEPEAEAWECVEGCPVAELDRQSGELRARGNTSPTKRRAKTGWWGGNIGIGPDGPIDPGDTGGASRFFFQAKAPTKERWGILSCECKAATGTVGPVTLLRSLLPSSCERCGAPLKVSSHPTQKPIALMRHLVRLVTPPGGTVLDCFMGSGSTGCACVQEGFDFVGIDAEEEYVAIAEKRIAYWASEPQRSPRRPAVRKSPPPAEPRSRRGTQLALEIPD